jgi:hypothetical protein
VRGFFTFLYQERGGIFVLLVCIAFAAGVIRYLAWIFGWGRFAPDRVKSTGTLSTSTLSDSRFGFVIATFFTNLINDFRHLLALILVLIFAAVLGAAMWRAATVEDFGKAVQGVAATLGGLIGSIIGYYFGESAVKRSQPAIAKPTPAGPSIQSPTTAEAAAAAPGITPAAAPPPPDPTRGPHAG